MFWVNAIGMATGLGALYVHYRYALDKARLESILWRALAAFTAFHLGVWMGYISFDMLALVAVVVGTAQYGVPLMQARQVMVTGDSSRLSRLGASVGAASCALWAAYGWSIGDGNVWGPNAVGLVACLIQLALIVLYPPKESKGARYSQTVNAVELLPKQFVL